MNDDISGPSAGMSGAPIPPALADQVTAVASSGAESAASVDESASALAQSVAASVGAAYSDVSLIIDTSLGSLDTSTNAAESTVNAVLQKASDSLLNSNLGAETELSNAGAFVPIMSDQMVVDMNEPTGEMMVSRLFGSSLTELPTQSATELTVGSVIPNLPIPTAPGDPFGPGLPAPVDAPPVFTTPESPPVPPPAPEEMPVLIPDPEPELEPIPEPIPSPSPSPPPPPCGCAAPPPTCPAPAIYLTCPSPSSPPSPPTSPPYPPPVPPVPPVPPTSPPPPTPTDEEVEAPLGDGPVLVDAIGPLPAVRPQGVQAPIFADPNVCAQLDQYSRLFGTLFTPAGPGSDRSNSSVSEMLRTAQASAFTMADNIFGTSNPDAKEKALAQNYLLAGDWFGGYSQAFGAFQMFGDTITVNPNACWSLAVVIGSAHKAEGSSGMPLDYLTTPLQYLFKSLSPQYIPDQNELDEMLLQNLILESQWECWTKCHGNIPSRRKDVLTAKQPTLTPHELVDLERRTPEYDTLLDGMWNKNKYPYEFQRNMYRKLGEFVPGAADLVRFMVRDAFDPEVVKSGQLDKDFALKFYGPGGELAPGKAAAWAKAQGMTEDQFKYYWYSHWDYPSNTALYEMLHRLRPDRPEVMAWDAQFGASDPRALPPGVPPRPQVLTRADVRKIIEINDVAPAMVEPLLDISYHPITRTDAIDAFLSGAFDRDQLYHVFRDNGYDDPTAQTMVRIQETKKARRDNNLTGVWSIRKTINAYREGVIDANEADRLLTPLLPNAQTRRDALDLADREAEAGIQRSRIKRLKRGYIFGAYDDGAINQALIAIGVTPLKARQLRESWHEDKLGKYREPTARMIVGWLRTGVIVTGDAVARLLLLGYAQWDVDRMVNQAVIEWAERQEGKIDKAEKRADKIAKSTKTVRKLNQTQLQDQLAEAEAEIARRNADIGRIRKEMSDRGLPFDP